MNTPEGEILDSVVVFQTQEGAEVRASLLRLSRYAATIEIYSPDTLLKTSQALNDCRIFVQNRAVYAGRAVVQEIVNAGTMLVCSLVLEDLSFDTEFFSAVGNHAALGRQFSEFFQSWEKVCRVLPEFKVAVADIATFLIDVRHWLEQVEVGVRSSPRPDRIEQERAIIAELSPRVIDIIDTLFAKFEEIAARLETEARPVHRAYIQRHLHPIVLCAPFAYRAYHKPLGYAGDYETVNMMLRDPQEGSSLFAKVFNVWLLHQASAAAHRNRIRLLQQRLCEQTLNTLRTTGRARILSLGCGPAHEVNQFLRDSDLSDRAEFTLLDFDKETLRYVDESLREQLRRSHRNCAIHLVNKSVQQLLKDALRDEPVFGGEQFDLAYCAGLFDYLPDRTCKRLMSLLARSLRPGGLALATNVTPLSPNRGSLELILDWNLIYRDNAHLLALRPDEVPLDCARVQSDDTGINLFLEVRRTDVN